MRTTAWGSQGLEASIEGLGAMGMSAFYGDRDDEESTATLNRALDLGVSLIDTAEIYGPFLNEQLIGSAIGHRRDEFALATKFATHVSDDGERGPVDGSPEYARTAVERSLRHLGMETIDLYYLHRVDPDVPIEETIGAMSEFVTEGKVRYLGISEAAPETIRRAHATHPLTAVQTEYSLFAREPETNGVLDTTRELGIAFVAYSPLGRGLLTGTIASATDLEDDDFRRNHPRFTDENLQRNLAVVEKVKAIAETKGVTPGQLALAWVMHQEGVVTIPGTKRRKYLEENVAAADIELTADDLAQLDEAAPVGVTAGARYPEAGMRAVHL
ncbi:aldo/keto reductase [Aeromicrobium terrae]|uniref:Aldo/keto reductase n=1 Tax=Aeromicrobium terrae TaxID=2498846 RepID=A0A5C8NG60_9ACTN|nr:aldo/keto reductase [Aeromicrobium terrae]TXL57903.1 aldo/keto reductase [Aeromicrobium terrae]